MKRFSVFALLMAVAIGFTYALAFAGPSVSAAQAKSACGCTDCRCPDCNGEFCTCDVCECGNCTCLKASDTSNARALATACCPVAPKAIAKAGCGCEICKCPDCNGEFCTCEVCECVGCGCAK